VGQFEQGISQGWCVVNGQPECVAFAVWQGMQDGMSKRLPVLQGLARRVDCLVAMIAAQDALDR